ncbi:Vacuolar protein sorting-associated protein 26B-like, partial [Termitomyces sp. J132]
VAILVGDGKKLAHDGTKAEFVGSIASFHPFASKLFYNLGHHHEFLSLFQELTAPGEMRQSLATVVALHSILVSKLIHSVFRYHLKDIIFSKIYFLLEKIKHMELSIIRRETTGAAPNQYNKSETITKSKFKFLDSAPVRGETIPIHLLLGGFDLTPTFRDVDKKFSTRYYLNLVLNDEENRRYFKKQQARHLSALPRHQFNKTLRFLPQIKVIFVKISAEKTLAVQVNLHTSSDSRIGQKRR